MSADPNRRGKAIAMTLLTPFAPGRSMPRRALFWAARWLPLARLTVLRLKGIHFARWAIVSRFPPAGPRRRRRRLPRKLLLFESNYNGSWDGYLEAFAHVFPRGMWLIWGGCRDYPGAIPVGPFKDWVREQELAAGHYYAAYPDATTRRVLSALAVRRPVEELAARAPGLSPEQFRREYDALLAGIQRHL